jgi:hypothetical protein
MSRKAAIMAKWRQRNWRSVICGESENSAKSGGSRRNGNQAIIVKGVKYPGGMAAAWQPLA